MATIKQITYIKTLISQSSRKTKMEFESVFLTKDTPDQEIRYWIQKLEKELGRE